AAEQAAVPQRVQVGAHPVPGAVAQLDLEPVAAAIAGVAGVHGLVRIGDQVDHELQRPQPLDVAAAAIPENAGLGGDRSDHAVAAGTVAFRLIATAGFADI